MHKAVVLGLLAFAAEKVASQAGPWGQCGGWTDYTGPTTCVSGYYCYYSNPWYSQCIPGSPSGSSSVTTRSSTTSSRTTTSSRASSTTTSRISTTTRTSTTTLSRTTTLSTTTRSSTTRSTTTTASSSTVSGACPSFSPVTAAAAFAALNPGWNLGNTLDAVPNEGSWNNPPATLATLQQIKARGFNSIRIPVTWTHHFDTAAPDYTVNAAWMDRVEVVVDQALATGFWVILNVHHDSWGWMDYAAGADLNVIKAKFGKLWSQIGTRFKCKSSKLIFEAINEPTGSTESHAIELNNLNDIFLTSINNAGGENPRRVVSLSGLNMDAIKTTQWFQRGTLYPNQPWGLQFHYYSPYDFIFDAWGRTVWGSDSDKATLTSEFNQFKGNFSGIPTFIGEWDASPQNTEPAARWKYFDYFIREANRLGFSHIVWDNGLDHFQRATNTWVDPVAIDILFKATAGIPNALADSTTDQSATSQVTSAYLFHKVGAAVTAQSVKYTLNGNTLVSIKTAAGVTVPTSSYSVAADGTVTFTSAYLSTLLSPTATPGIKETLTVTFSAGAALTLKIVQYDTPTAPTTTYSLSSLSSDITIPINYKGLPVIAAVKAVKADGTYLADDWTVWLGPLQQARWTQGNWFWSDTGFVLYTNGINQLKAAGQAVTLTVEFFPRSLGENSLTLQFNP